MSSQVFNVGDVVRWSASLCKTTDHSKWDGSVGVMVDPSCSGWTAYHVCAVQWETGKLAEYQKSDPSCKVYAEHLELFYTELKYDPNQQADLEDDI